MRWLTVSQDQNQDRLQTRDMFSSLPSSPSTDAANRFTTVPVNCRSFNWKMQRVLLRKKKILMP